MVQRGAIKQKTPLLQLAQTIKQAAETFGHYFPQAQPQDPLILSSAPVASRGQVFKSLLHQFVSRIARAPPLRDPLFSDRWGAAEACKCVPLPRGCVAVTQLGSGAELPGYPIVGCPFVRPKRRVPGIFRCPAAAAEPSAAAAGATRTGARFATLATVQYFGVGRCRHAGTWLCMGFILPG